MLLLIDSEIRDGLVRYLGGRPYGEVVHAIAALQQLAPVDAAVSLTPDEETS